jgi:hypothetical protein
MFLPIISVINTGYLTYIHKDEVYKTKPTVSELVSIILTVLAILSLSLFIEYGMGKLFQLFIIILGLCLIDSRTQQFQDRLYYFMGVALTIALYIMQSNLIRVFIVLIIITIIVSLEVIKEIIKNDEKKIKLTNNLKTFLMGTLLTSLVLIWGEYGKEPNVKYIKLFMRK